ncbi:hypothetical protein ABXT28_22265 [Ralstonia sp. SM1878_UCD538_TZ35]
MAAPFCWVTPTQYKNIRSKLTWECHRGHVWETSPNSMFAGHWCPSCAILDRIRAGISTSSDTRPPVSWTRYRARSRPKRVGWRERNGGGRPSSRTCW